MHTIGLPCRIGKIEVVTKTLYTSWDLVCLVIFFMLMLIIVFSTLMFVLERGEWDDELQASVLSLEGASWQ